jgi:hypothetical protein
VPHLESYAIIDVAAESKSHRKILMILDDRETAEEIADELDRRNCEVVIQAITRRSGMAVIQLPGLSATGPTTVLAAAT